MSRDAAAVTSTVTSADGTTIVVETVGSGPALVLVDGALCSLEFGPARDVAAQLAGHFTVHLYDRRGRGGSGDTLPYAVEREVDDLAAVIAAAGADVFVMGQSSGASLALEAAAAGVPMRGLAVYEAPYVGVTPVRGRTPDYLADLQGLLAQDKRGAMVDYFMVRMVGGPAFLPVMMRLMPKVWRQLTAVAPTLLNDTRILGDFEVHPERLGAVRVPTLVMGGSKAKPNMMKAVEDVAAAVTGRPPVILAGQTHNVSPAVLVPELIAFFQGLERKL
jgi:pimeloyl-ACP methyl ester carboxylesterase